MSGSSDAYRGYGYLYVNGWQFSASGAAHDDAFGDRGFYTTTVNLADFDVQRSAWVPAVDGNWARYCDSFTNTADFAQDLNVSYAGYLGSVDQTFTIASSNGDGYYDYNDTWIITDDADASGDPTLAHVFSGPGAAVQQSSGYLSVAPWDWGSTYLSWSYSSIHVEPGETVSIMWFAVQEEDRAAAQAAVDDLLDLIGQAHADLGPEGEFVVNWDFGTLPKASVDGPDEIPEGGNGHFFGFGSDPDRRPLVLEWDLDLDGTYELEADEVDWSADGVDGPDNGTVAFRVSNDLPQYDSDLFQVNVVNVAPTAPGLVSPPDGAVRRGPEIELAATQASDIPEDDLSYRLEIHGNADYTDLLRIVPILPDAIGEDGIVRAGVNLDEGTYWWRLHATDDDGGSGDWLNASFTLDDDAPIEEDAGPADAGGDSDADTDSDTDTGSATASDTDSESASDTETASESDTDTETEIVSPPPDKKDDGGCGCNAGPSAPSSGALLLLVCSLFLVRRRNRNSEVSNA